MHRHHPYGGGHTGGHDGPPRRGGPFGSERPFRGGPLRGRGRGRGGGGMSASSSYDSLPGPGPYSQAQGPPPPLSDGGYYGQYGSRSPSQDYHPHPNGYSNAYEQSAVSAYGNPPPQPSGYDQQYRGYEGTLGLSLSDT
jgi:hypothetical protein